MLRGWGRIEGKKEKHGEIRKKTIYHDICVFF